MHKGGARTLLVCGALTLIAAGCVRPDSAAPSSAGSGAATTLAPASSGTESSPAAQPATEPPAAPATTAPPAATVAATTPPTAAPVATAPPVTDPPVAVTPATEPPAPPVTARPTVTVRVTTAPPVTARPTVTVRVTTAPPVTARPAVQQSFPSCTSDTIIELASRNPGYQQSAELVQRRLQQLGYDPGAIDGFIGPDTLSALESWAYDQGYGKLGYVYEYGEIDWGLIEKLGLNCSASTDCYLEVEPGAPVVYSETARTVQQRLNELGYSPGAVDGYMGPNSQAALERWAANGYDRLEYWDEAGGYNISESGFRELGIYC